MLNPLLKWDSRWIHGFFLGTLLHIALDIPTGIQVFAPFHPRVINWFPLVYTSKLSAIEHLMHPYVIAELMIIGVAFGVFVRGRLAMRKDKK